ncbi:hypothetical protein ACQ4PT_042916 [Festuca glaucescens]
MQQRHASSAPRALHALLHRPSLPCASGAALRRPASASTGSSRRLFHSHIHRSAGAIAGANKQMPAMMGASRSFSSHDNFNNQLQEEDLARTKRKKDLAMALMNDLPTAPKGAADHSEEINGINHLLGLLDVPDATPTSAANDAGQAARLHAELRSVVEKSKNALLIELLKDSDAREERKAELVEAGRRYRDALVGHDERRAFQNLHTELKSLQQRVTSAEKNCKGLMDAVDAGRMDLESASATANSIRADVSRLGIEVTTIKNELTKEIEEEVEAQCDGMAEMVVKAKKEAEAAYRMSLFVGCTTAAAAVSAALRTF